MRRTRSALHGGIRVAEEELDVLRGDSVGEIARGGVEQLHEALPRGTEGETAERDGERREDLEIDLSADGGLQLEGECARVVQQVPHHDFALRWRLGAGRTG